MTQNKTYIALLICAFFGVGIVSVLFALSEKDLHRDNSFTRRFPPHPAIETHRLDLKYNSYYIAGAAKGQIYLGNVTAPLNLMILDTAFQKKQKIILQLDQDKLPFKFIQLCIIPPHFFLVDGTVPYIARGNITDWKAHSVMDNALAYFAKIQPMDSVTLAIRAVSSRTQENVLGKISLSNTGKVTISNKLLQKQIDGMFDTDGVLQYNEQLQQLVYTYYYRNQYIIANKNLQQNFLGKTIDTISRAQLQIRNIASKNQRKLAAPPLMVNKYSATYGKYLFVNSQLVGRYEPIDMWQQASIIDVYNLVKNTYEFSFYIYDIGKDKLKTFQVLEDKFIGLIGNHIVTYQLYDQFKEMYPKHTTAMDTQ